MAGSFGRPFCVWAWSVTALFATRVMDVVTGSKSITANVDALFDSAHGGEVGWAVLRLKDLDMSMAGLKSPCRNPCNGWTGGFVDDIVPRDGLVRSERGFGKSVKMGVPAVTVRFIG